MSKNSIKPEQSEPGLFVNFETPKFTTKTPVATAVEQPEMGDVIGKFLQAVLQPTLQDIERQLTPRQAISERTQMVMTKVLEALTGVQANEIDFWATNILDEQNGEARRREIQCPSLLPVTSVPVPDEVLDAKRSPIDKILQSEQALALYNFRIGEGMLAHLCEQQEENLAIDILSQMIHNLREAERTHFARDVIVHAGSTGHCQKRHGEQRRGGNYELAVQNPIAGKGKGQDQEAPSICTISYLEIGDETNVKSK
ncbi:MAG: hypothetical protein EZS28_034379 [Streblomastix strix]|uniref:Uncharacterized protein n=1 Tax=Streblomastix strix TaxID=222440 RepID=A0A5J4UIQ3_9EUKA|nr:MAG: hypothetical protein EZS28_034379 [Streblomastix strix]